MSEMGFKAQFTTKSFVDILSRVLCRSPSCCLGAHLIRVYHGVQRICDLYCIGGDGVGGWENNKRKRMNLLRKSLLDLRTRGINKNPVIVASIHRVRLLALYPT